MSMAVRRPSVVPVPRACGRTATAGSNGPGGTTASIGGPRALGSRRQVAVQRAAAEPRHRVGHSTCGTTTSSGTMSSGGHDLQRTMSSGGTRLSVEGGLCGIAVSGGSTAQGGSTASGGSMGQGATQRRQSCTGGIMGSGGRATTTATGGAKATGGTVATGGSSSGPATDGGLASNTGDWHLRQLVRSRRQLPDGQYQPTGLSLRRTLRHGPGDGQCDLVRLPNGLRPFHPSGINEPTVSGTWWTTGTRPSSSQPPARTSKSFWAIGPTTMANPTT